MPKEEEISVRNTKQEIIKAYHEVVAALKTKGKELLKPDLIKEEKQKQETVAQVDAMTDNKIAEDIQKLKNHFGEALAEISEKLQSESEKYTQIKKAIVFKEKELKDLYGIEVEAETLAALIETHKEKKALLTEDFEREKSRLNGEIGETRQKWQLEKEGYETELAEKKQEQKKKREREEEEYSYKIKRERELEQNRFNDEQARLNKELTLQKGDFEALVADKEKALEIRERTVSENEKRHKDLEEKAASFEKDLAKTVERERSLTTERLGSEFKAREELLKQQVLGEKNVMKTRIEALEQVVEQQKIQIDRLSSQVENSYRKVEDIALKALDSEKRKSSPAMEYMIKEKQPGSGET